MRVLLVALSLSIGVLPGMALAATTTALLGRVPALPHDAPAAYGQWTDGNENLTPGPLFRSLEADVKATAMAPFQRQQAAAADIAAKYNTPQGQAELKTMSLAQKMALAQQIQQAQMGGPMGPTTVSESDGALLRKTQPNPAAAQIRIKMSDISQRLGQIETQWHGDEDKLDRAQTADIAKLAVCRNEAGEPSAAALKAVMLKYADRRIALAPAYLAKYQALANEKRGLVAQEAKYADDAQAAWQQLKNPMLKNQMQPGVAGAVANAATDAGVVLSIVENGSKHAAQTVARKKSLEAQYKDAKGC